MNQENLPQIEGILDKLASESDISECFRLIDKLILNSNKTPEMMYFLGTIFLYGLGVGKNWDKAVEYFKEATEHRNGLETLNELLWGWYDE